MAYLNSVKRATFDFNIYQSLFYLSFWCVGIVILDRDPTNACRNYDSTLLLFSTFIGVEFTVEQDPRTTNLCFSPLSTRFNVKTMNDLLLLST